MPLSAPLLVLLVLLYCLPIKKKKICILIVNIFAMWDLQNLLHVRSCTFQGKSGHVQLEAPWGEVLPCSLLTAVTCIWGVGGCQGPCGRLPFGSMNPSALLEPFAFYKVPWQGTKLLRAITWRASAACIQGSLSMYQGTSCSLALSWN